MAEKSKKAVIAEVAADYMEQTSLHGYRYLTEPGRHWFERYPTSNNCYIRLERKQADLQC